MSVSFQCDGCHNTVDAPARIGHVLVRDYCETCKATAEEFLRAEEEHRVKMQEKFTADRAKLLKKYSANDFKLPDVP